MTKGRIMRNDTVIITVSKAVQIGEDAWKQEYTSTEIKSSSTIEDVLKWAETTLGDKSVNINDVRFSKVSK